MNIAICDDSREYRDLLKEHIGFYFRDRGIDFSCREYDSGEALLAQEQDYDIVFLDIEMPGLNGIQTAKRINTMGRGTVVFIVTAYQDYLDDAMDLNVFRYIDKPIDSQRLYKGLDRAVEYIDGREIAFTSRDNDIVVLDKNDIICIEVSGKRVYVTTAKRQYVAKENMDFFRKKLTASYFAVPHNSYIVNFNYVVGFSRKKITLSNMQTVSVAPKRQSEIKAKFMRFMGEEGSLRSQVKSKSEK